MTKRYTSSLRPIGATLRGYAVFMSALWFDYLSHFHVKLISGRILRRRLAMDSPLSGLPLGRPTKGMEYSK